VAWLVWWPPDRKGPQWIPPHEWPQPGRRARRHRDPSDGVPTAR